MTATTHWITVAAAATELGVSESKIHELARNDRLAAAWEGRTRKIDAASVLAYKKSRPVANMPAPDPAPVRLAGDVPLFHHPARRFLIEDTDGGVCGEGAAFGDGAVIVVRWTLPGASIEVFTDLNVLVERNEALGDTLNWIDK